jgi:hypothetical protein
LLAVIRVPVFGSDMGALRAGNYQNVCDEVVAAFHTNSKTFSYAGGIWKEKNF